MLGPDAAPVRSIKIALPEAAVRYPGCDSNGPFERSLQAKMSIPFGVAAVIVHRQLAEANYRDLGNAQVNSLARATELVTSPELTAAFPARQGATIELTLEDDRRLSIGQTDVTPATEAEVRQRFREAAAVVVGEAAAEAIESFVDGIEDMHDAGELPSLCSLPESDGGTASRQRQSRSGRAFSRSAQQR